MCRGTVLKGTSPAASDHLRHIDVRRSVCCMLRRTTWKDGDGVNEGAICSDRQLVAVKSWKVWIPNG